MARFQEPKSKTLEVISRTQGTDISLPPLLLVHGAWHGAWCWDYGFLDRLWRKGLEVHAISLRGHGQSHGRERLQTIRVREFVDDIVEVADSLRSDPIVIGHSMGGFLTQKLMERRTLPGAVLLASAPPDGIRGFLWNLLQADPIGVLKANATLNLNAVVSTTERVKRLLFSDWMSRAEIEHFESRLGHESLLAYIDMLFLDLVKPTKGTKVLVIGAENDAIFPVETTNRIANVYGTQALIFPEMAHDMMLDSGWENVADMIAEWVFANHRQRELDIAA